VGDPGVGCASAMVAPRSRSRGRTRDQWVARSLSSLCAGFRRKLKVLTPTTAMHSGVVTFFVVVGTFSVFKLRVKTLNRRSLQRWCGASLPSWDVTVAFFLYFLFIFDFVCNINPPHNFVWVQLFVALFTNGAKAYFEDNRKVSFC
jgi:hypothetical protein